MSIAVEIPALADAILRYGASAFFLTTSDLGRAHVSHVGVTWQGDQLRVGVGRSGAGNVAARPATVLLWPPIEPGGYSLIVDVDAIVVDDHALLTPQRAVLHRPAPSVAPGVAGGNDCAPL